MEDSRGTSIVVRLPYDKEDLAFDAIVVRFTGDTIYITTVREGRKTIREYEPFPTASDYNEICVVAYTTSEDE